MTRPGEKAAVDAAVEVLAQYWKLPEFSLDPYVIGDAERVVDAAYPIIAKAVAENIADQLERQNREMAESFSEPPRPLDCHYTGVRYGYRRAAEIARDYSGDQS